MRTTAITALVLSCLTLGEAGEFADLLRFTSTSDTTVFANPGSRPYPCAPTITDGSDEETIE